MYAIGNPFGLDHTLTQGIISGLGRELQTPGPRGLPLRNVIQTDAAINPGARAHAHCLLACPCFSHHSVTLNALLLRNTAAASDGRPVHAASGHLALGTLTTAFNLMHALPAAFAVQGALTRAPSRDGLSARRPRSPQYTTLKGPSETAGNSGGVLLDSRGRLIGINTAIASPSGASNGVGFAIPIDAVKGLVDQVSTPGL